MWLVGAKPTCVLCTYTRTHTRTDAHTQKTLAQRHELTCCACRYVKELSLRLVDAQRTPEQEAAFLADVDSLVKDLVGV